MANVKADVKAVGASILPDFNGTLTASSIVITSDVTLSVVDHALKATVTSTDVAMNDVKVNINGLLGWLFGWLVDWIVDSFVPDIEQQFATEVASQIGPILEDALGAFAFDSTFDVPSPDPSSPPLTLNLVTDFKDVVCTPAGVTFIMRSAAYGALATPYDNLGAMGRANCGTGSQVLVVPKTDALEISLSDDTLNQLLYALWRGGFLEFPVPPELLGGIDLGPYGITDLQLTLSGMLQPTASDCGADGELKLHIGDLRIDASMKLFGQPVDVVIYVSLVTDLELSVADGQIAIAIGAVDSVELEVSVVQDKLVSAEGPIRQILEQQLVAGLVGALGGDSLGGFPLPEIDLSGAVEGVPPGTVLTIHPLTNVRSGGNTIIGGTL